MADEIVMLGDAGAQAWIARALDQNAAVAHDVSATAPHIVIAAASMQALETAARLRQKGLSVTVLISARQLPAGMASPLLSRLLLAAHRVNGVQILDQATIAGTRHGAVDLEDGRTIAADACLKTQASTAWSISDQYDLHLQRQGAIMLPDADAGIRRREEGPGISFLHIEAGRLRAVESINDDETFASACALLEKDAFDLDTAVNGEVPLIAALGDMSPGRPRA